MSLTLRTRSITVQMGMQMQMPACLVTVITVRRPFHQKKKKQYTAHEIFLNSGFYHEIFIQLHFVFPSYLKNTHTHTHTCYVSLSVVPKYPST